jgi:N-acetylmuramoyl-L-alanine amidase
VNAPRVVSLSACLIVALAGCGGAGAPSARRPAPASTSTAARDAHAISTIPALPAAGADGGSAGAGGASAPDPALASVEALRPPIHFWLIPYGAARKREMAAYSLRHYGEDSYLLRHPKVIVEHYTETATALEAYNTFAPDVPDSEFHELPATCAHFLVEPGGRIDQLVSLTLRCRHTVGLNWTAIGIEHVGSSDQQILGDRAQLRASLALTRWLRCRFGIALRNVIGHNESLSSPYHRELVASWRHQTHADWNHADMTRYRALLARLACPR